MFQLRIREIFRDSRHTLVAVESVETLHSKTNAACLLHGKVEPVAVVVRSPDAVYALDMRAKPVAIERLRETVPGLDVILAAFDKV